jgi:cell division septation protein DedD
MVTFRLHRKGVVLLALGAVLLGVLLYMAGCLVGQRRGAVAQIGKPAGLPKVPAAPAAPALKRPALQAAAAPGLPAAPPAFALRAGAFTDEAEAKALVQDLASRGLQASLVPVPAGGGAVLQTVLLGRYASREEAAAALAELARREGISAVVVAAPRRPAGGGA